MTIKIISGGQAGADYAGLLAAKELGWPTGGWAPKGWRVDPTDPRFPSGVNPELREFGLRECMKPGYPARTMRNVDEAQLTIAFMLKGVHSVGTSKTLGYCQMGKWQEYDPNRKGFGYRDYLLIDDISSVRRNEVAHYISDYLIMFGPTVINVAGHRQTTVAQAALAKGIRDYDFEQVVKDILIAGFLGLDVN